MKVFLVSVKAKVHPNLHRKYLFMSGLFLEVKGEGKKRKLAECAGAYVRVGACPARRVKGSLCGVGRF